MLNQNNENQINLKSNEVFNSFNNFEKDNTKTEDANNNEVEGKDVKEKVENKVEKTKPPIKKSDARKNLAVTGIVIGAIFCLLGIIGASGFFYYGEMIGTSSDFTEYTSYNYYGGDAYTGIQQAGADASNNAAIAADNIAITNELISYVVSSLNIMIGILIVSMGVFMILYFTNKLVSIRKESDSDVQQIIRY